MKKLFLFTLALGIAITSFAQHHQAKVSANLAKQSKKAVLVNLKEVNPPAGALQSNPLVSAKAITGDSLGETWYDLQTNQGVQNRIVKHAGGTISAVWIYSNNSGFADRGTGYNYYNGTTWQPFPTARIEASVRTGWPSLTVANGNEVVIAHNATALTMSTRTLGAGAWTSATIPHSGTHELSWPRTMSPGITSQVIHLIAEDYTNVHGMLYSRSSDGGTTWDIQDSILPGVDPVSEMLPTGSESYALDVKGDTVGILVGDMTTDIVLIKSFNGGDTWTSQIVYDHPITLWNTSLVGDPAGTSDANGDGVPDTLSVSDGRLALVIGEDGVFHVFFGITKILRDDAAAADNFNFWPYTDGLVYWNSTQPAIVPVIDFFADTLMNKVGYMVDVNGNDTIDFNTDAGNGSFGDFAFTSLSSMPSAAVGTDGAIYCTYSSVVENTDFGDGRAFRNIYAIKSVNNGATWTEPVNITPDDFSECLFGSLNRKVDTDLHLVFQRGVEPGISLQPATGNPHLAQNKGIIYVKQSNDLSAGVHQIDENTFSVEQNYPNPFSTSTTIKVNLKKASALCLVVTNILGQQIMNINSGNVGSGPHTFTIDRSNLNAGIYFYTVKAGEHSATKKMIVE